MAHPADLFRYSGGDAELNRMIRNTCAECGAPVKWVDAAAAEHSFDVEQAQRFIGGSASGAEFWACTSCGNAGVLDGAMGSF